MSDASSPDAPNPSRPQSRATARRLGFAAAVVAAGLLAAACSSSGGSGKPTSSGGASTTGSTASASTTAGSSATSAATGTPFVIGNIASATGTFAAGLGGVPLTVDAWTKWTNAHGGINGHPVKVITEDDGGIPSKGITAAQTLISDKVQAVVGSASNTEAGWYKAVTAAKIPVLGGQTNGQGLYQLDPLLFPTGTTSTFGVLNIAAKAGKKSVGVMYCAEVPACASQVGAIKSVVSANAASLSGVKIAYTGSISYAAPNYTAQCLAAKQDGVDSLYVSDASAVTVRVIHDCASQAFTPLVVGNGPSADNAWLTESALNGAYVVEGNFSWFGRSTPTEQQFHAALQQYEPSLLTAATTFNSNTSQTWASLEVFKAVVERSKLTPSSTSTDVVNALYALPKGWSLKGITPPLTFGGAGKPNPPVDCYFTVQIKGGKWTEPSPGAVTCPSS